MMIGILVILLLAAAWVRSFRLDKSPASVNWDEAALGYNAYSLLLTGRDEFGKALPVSLRSFDDYKPAGYAYLSVPAVKLFGLSEASTRMTSVISGTLAVFLIVYITAKLTGNYLTGLIAGAVMAGSPWAIHFSRIAFESNVATMWYLAGISAFILGLKKRQMLPVSLALFIISMYIYHAQRAIALPTFAALAIIYRQRFVPALKENWKSWLIIGTGLLIPLGSSFLTEAAGNRLTATNIFKLWPFVPGEFPQLIFNPVYSLMWQITGQFLAYFSPANLFLRGSQEPILRIPGLGLFNIELLPFWLVGLWQTFRNKKWGPGLWVLLALTPLPGVITWNWFSVVRTVSLYPIMAIVIAVGITWVSKKITKYWGKIIFGFATGGILGAAFLYNLLTITLFAPYVTYGDFQPGFETSVPYMLAEAAKYDKVVIESPHIAPYIFVLFYGKYPPQQYLQDAGLNRKNSGTEDYQFGKFEFRKITRADLYGKNILLMGPTTAIPDWRKEEMQKSKIKVEDFLDPMGYIGFRVADL